MSGQKYGSVTGNADSNADGRRRVSIRAEEMQAMPGKFHLFIHISEERPQLKLDFARSYTNVIVLMLITLVFLIL